MTTFDCQNLVDRYSKWVRENIDTRTIDGSCRIVTPFLDRHRDYIEVFVEQRPSGHLLISDDAATINDLHTSGLSLTGDRRNEEVDAILHRFGVQRAENELRVEATEETFAQRKHDLLQAVLAVSDLHVMAQSTVAATFADDVAAYLEAREVRMTRDLKLTGLSGLDESFDFVIPRSTRRPERVIKAISDPNRSNFVSLMFAWQDVRHTRQEDAQAYAIINDLHRSASQEHLNALGTYKISPVLWSQRATAVREFED